MLWNRIKSNQQSFCNKMFHVYQQCSIFALCGICSLPRILAYVTMDILVSTQHGTS